VFLVQVVYAHAVRILLCDAWFDSPALLNHKALSLLRTVKRTKSKMLIFCRVLIFVRIFMTFARYFLDM